MIKATRNYKTHDEYLIHQASKFNRADVHKVVQENDEKLEKHIAALISKFNVAKKSDSVLCLGARIGSEVKAFKDHGCFAVGIDINPREKNKHVLYGDFCDIKFPAECVDVVYMNCFDHVQVTDIVKVIDGIKRVLRREGTLFMFIAAGVMEDGAFGEYEAILWDKIDDVVSEFISRGFTLKQRNDQTFPMRGQDVVFTK